MCGHCTEIDWMWTTTERNTRNCDYLKVVSGRFITQIDTWMSMHDAKYTDKDSARECMSSPFLAFLLHNLGKVS